MVSSVTIQGGGNTTISLAYDSTSNFTLAQEIASYLNAGISAGNIVVTYNGENISPPPPGDSGVLVDTGEEQPLMNPNYSTEIVTRAGHTALIDPGLPDATILSGANTDLTFVARSGSGTVVAGGGNNNLEILGTQPGNWMLYTGSGNDMISALGDTNATIGAGGGHNHILLGGGNDLVISDGNDMIAGGSGSATIDATNARSDFVQGGQENILFLGGAGGATLLGGGGSDTYFGATSGSVGKQLIEGGSGGNNFLQAGNGAATLVGGGNNDQLYAYGGSNQVLVAGAGNETLSAALSTGNDSLTAGPGNDLLVGGSGNDTFIGGSGNTTVMAGSGVNTFAFLNHNAGSSMVVEGITDPSQISIDLPGYSAGQIRQILAGQTVQDGSVSINLRDGTQVTFMNVSSLSQSNFVTTGMGSGSSHDHDDNHHQPPVHPFHH